ncbi:MAG: linear amide C-N hydrolase [Clostridia bacterium]|nr:linear amide C-N hydrolase [Clostridia bacterium]
MCTVLTYRADDLYYGRTLDYERSFEEAVAVIPRRLPLHFRHMPDSEAHYAFMGMASTMGKEPLFYDGVNEKGVCAAALRFAASAVYHESKKKGHALASFEVIPYVLGSCATLAEVRAALANISVTGEGYSDELPPSPLHWFFADESGALVLESTADGVHIHDDPVGVLTNEPPFPEQMRRLSDYRHLSADPGENRLLPAVSLPLYTRGTGAIGLPGDLSSPSRFVRAAFTAGNAEAASGTAAVSRCFQILDTVRVVRGCCQTEDGSASATVYAAVCNMSRGIYYCETEENRTPCAVMLRGENLDGNRPILYSLHRKEQILWQNENSKEND